MKLKIENREKSMKQSQFFEKTNKINKPLARLTKKKEKHKLPVSVDIPVSQTTEGQ